MKEEIGGLESGSAVNYNNKQFTLWLNNLMSRLKRKVTRENAWRKMM